MKIESTNAYDVANLVANAILDNQGVTTDGKTVTLAENATLSKQKKADSEKVVLTLIGKIGLGMHYLSPTFKPEQIPQFSDDQLKAIKNNNKDLFRALMDTLHSKAPLETRINTFLEIVTNALPSVEPFASQSQLDSCYLVVSEHILDKSVLTDEDWHDLTKFWQELTVSKRDLLRGHLNSPQWQTLPPAEQRESAVNEFIDSIHALLLSKLESTLRYRQTHPDVAQAPVPQPVVEEAPSRGSSASGHASLESNPRATADFVDPDRAQ